MTGPYDDPELVETENGFEVTWWPKSCIQADSITLRTENRQLLVRATEGTECLTVDTEVVLQITDLDLAGVSLEVVP